MPPKDRKPPGRSEETAARDAERRKRLADALRQNLRKRKVAADKPPSQDPDG